MRVRGEGESEGESEGEDEGEGEGECADESGRQTHTSLPLPHVAPHGSLNMSAAKTFQCEQKR